MQNRRFDLEAYFLQRVGFANEDGGRGYEQGVRVLATCPLCGAKEKAWLNASGCVKCFRAGCELSEGISALEYVQRAEGYRTRTEARLYLEREFPAIGPRSARRPGPAAYDDWCALPPSAPLVEHPGPRYSGGFDEARAFVARQWGLTLRDAERWGLRYCVQGRHAWRVVIPVAMGGAVVGFQARSYRNGEPKYRTSQHGARGEDGAECGRPAEALLFNIDAVQEGCGVILVEGAGDAMAFGGVCGVHSAEGRGVSSGDPESPATLTGSKGVAVALLGLVCTDEKAALLAAKRPGRVIVAADAEPEAEARGRVIAETLALAWGLDAVVGRWVGAKDAGAGARLEVSSVRRGLAGLVAGRMGR